jgi:hypothetical protein
MVLPASWKSTKSDLAQIKQTLPPTGEERLEWERYRNDPVAWAQELHLLPGQLDEWQCQVLQSRSKRILLNCSRQAGKSFTCGLLALHTAIFEPGSLVLLISPSLRQSIEIFRHVGRAYGLNPAVPSTSESVLKLELCNGSRVIALPGTEKTVRGYSGVSLLVIDEASLTEDDLYYSLRPVLAVSDGRLVALSTPRGKRGWWYQEWQEGKEWEKWEVPVSMCPRISAEFLQQEREKRGRWWFSQEYECQFAENETALFRSEDIDAMFTDEVVEWS